MKSTARPFCGLCGESSPHLLKRSKGFFSTAVTISEIMGCFRDKITEGKQSNQSLYMTNEPL